MLLIADVHGAAGPLRRVATLGEPLLVLGDLINFIDYRTNDGIVTEIAGRSFVEEMVRLRSAGLFDDARRLWRGFAQGRELELQAAFDHHVDAEYRRVCGALEGAEAYVTFGNVDRPDVMASHLPAGVRFVDGEVLEIEGLRIGVAGGGMVSLNTPGEVSEDEMAVKLEGLGHVDVLCTHLPPAGTPLSRDVIGGSEKSSQAILAYLRRRRPSYHYFGDVHQPQATTWRIGDTICRNVGYFRATGRPIRHPVGSAGRHGAATLATRQTASGSDEEFDE